MGLRKLSCCRNVSGWSFWTWRSLPVCCDGPGAQVITYHAFEPLTGCLGQFCLLIMSFHVLACTYAVALPHKLIIWDSDCFLVCTSSVGLLCFSNQLTVTFSLERWPSLKPGLSDHIAVLCSLWSILQSTQPYFAEYVNPYCLETGNQKTQVSTILPQFFFLVSLAPTFSVPTHVIISAARISVNFTSGVMLYSSSYRCAHSEVILSHLTAAFQKSILSSSEPLGSCV